MNTHQENTKQKEKPMSQDGSMSVLLNALPVNGKLHIREQKQEEQTS